MSLVFIFKLSTTKSLTVAIPALRWLSGIGETGNLLFLDCLKLVCIFRLY